MKSVVLTGGQSSQGIYKALAQMFEFKALTDIQFFLSDERCLPNNVDDNNFHMVMKTLFPFGLPKNCVFHEMYKEEMGIEKSMKNYEKILPKKIDLLLLSVGLDGHIASIFPRSKILNSNHLVDVVYGGNPLVERISLTPSAIKRAKKTCVFALGLEKSQLYRNALIDSKNFEEMPARLVLNAEWLNSDDINGIAKRISNLICAL